MLLTGDVGGTSADDIDDGGEVIIRWTTQPIEGSTRDPYRLRTGMRRTLWFLFIPVYSTTTWGQDRSGR